MKTRFVVLFTLFLAACVPVTPPPGPAVQYGSGGGEVLADAVAIRGIKGEMGQSNAAPRARLAAAEADWLAAAYPGWMIVGSRSGLDGYLAYDAVTIRSGSATRTVYFDISEYFFSVAPAP